jgi:PIN domain nuclease of toxin-antitoxin system
VAGDVILLDTHALLWWTLDPERLSPTALAVCEQMERDGGFASSISLWEIGVKVRNGRLELGLPFDEFARRLARTDALELLPVDAAIWVRTVGLDWAHRDPADRVIVATALTKDLPILSKDEAIRSYGGVSCIW